MKIYIKAKDIQKKPMPLIQKKAQNLNESSPTPTYTVRSMLKDLDKWEQFIEGISTESMDSTESL